MCKHCSIVVLSICGFMCLWLTNSLHGADLPDHAQKFLQAYCVNCHGPDKQKGDFRLDDLDPDIGGAAHNTWAELLELIEAREMPPRKSPQPDAATRKAFIDWLIVALDAAGGDAAFARQLPEKGNNLPHELLFGTQAKRQATATPARLWRLNPKAYKATVGNRIGATKLFSSHRGGGNLTAPFTLSTDRGIRDYAFRYMVRDGEIEQMTDQTLAVIARLQNNTSLPEDVRSGLGIRRKKSKALPAPAAIDATVTYLFTHMRRRPPTNAERQRYATFARQRIVSLGPITGARIGYAPILLHPEAIFRREFGHGKADQHGRLQLSATELAGALAYALTDAPPDQALMAAAQAGKLASVSTLAEHIKRLLRQYGPVAPHAKNKDAFDLRSGSKMLRFFREYFDYTHAASIFKDDAEKRKHRIRKYHPGELINSVDTMIAEIVDRDRDVLAQLLTFKTPRHGFPAGKHWFSPAYRGKGKDRKKVRHARQVSWKADDRNGPLLVGVLQQPAWLIAHSDNFDNHPIKRGRWLRERLLGGQIPDTPITVDAQLPDEPKASLRHRMRVTRVSECWLCHKHMDDLGLTFEGFNHFGYRRSKELGQAVNTSGAITLTGVAALDGPVKDATELIERLARSEHVEQVFVRHVFRFFLGRNETAADAAVLQDAQHAYRNSGGSMQALIVSLLTSDAFRYRWAPGQEAK